MGQQKKFLKKDREKFVKDMEKFFSSIGTETESPISNYKCYHIDTAFGKLEVRGIDPSGSVLTVFARFIGDRKDFAEINQWGLDCNPYTGKWNQHHMRGNVDEIVDHIKMRYAVVLSYTRNSDGEIELGD